jgi:hypothetical protein
MRISKAIVIVSVVLLAVVTIASVFAYRTAKWALGRIRPSEITANGSPAGSGSQTEGDESAHLRAMEAMRTVKTWNIAMAEAFSSGILPKPLPSPIGDPDQVAATLAKQIAARDANSTPALLTALQMAGFSIRGTEGKIEGQPTGPSQGIALNAWQVAAMAKLYGNGANLTLADVGAILDKLFLGAEKVPITDLLVESIRSASKGRKPSRFLARFIAELGRNSSNPYDLLSGKVDASEAHVDAVQLRLIIIRLAADVGAARPTPSSRARPTAWEYDAGFESPLVLRPAVFHPGEAKLLLVDQESGGEDVPCKLDDYQLTYLDGSAIADSLLFDKLLEGLEEISFFKGFKQFRRYTNILLTLAKAIWTYAALNIDMQMEDAPLVRTDDTTAGQTRVLKAHVTFDISKWQILNCVRPFLDLTGLDFGNLPTHGDADGAGVEWILLQGGVERGTGFHVITPAKTRTSICRPRRRHMCFSTTAPAPKEKPGPQSPMSMGLPR